VAGDGDVGKGTGDEGEKILDRPNFEKLPIRTLEKSINLLI
jgi:hypothetical protein